MKREKVLVTGGSGFIGSHLCRTLISLGYDVVSLDVRPFDQPPPQLKVIKADIRDKEAMKAALDGVDAVVHFAALVSVELCQKEPVHSYEVNLQATAGILELLKSRPGIRFIYSSSAAVYGAGGKKEMGLLESETLDSPLSHYAAQKIACENMIRLFVKQDHLKACIFRFFNVYGEGQDPSSPYSGVISIFQGRAKKGQEILIHGDGSQTRDFVHVSDIVKSCVLALTQPSLPWDGEPINLGSGQPISIRQLAEIFVKKFPNLKLSFAPVRMGDVPHSLSSIVRAQEWLNWKPNINLEDGLNRLIER